MFHLLTTFPPTPMIVLQDIVRQASGSGMTFLLTDLGHLGIKCRSVTHMNGIFKKIHFPNIVPLFDNLMMSLGEHREYALWNAKVMATEVEVAGRAASVE
jgi:hypothetical protein